MSDFDQLQRIIGELRVFVARSSRDLDKIEIAVPHETFMRIVTLPEMSGSLVYQGMARVAESGTLELRGVKIRDASRWHPAPAARMPLMIIPVDQPR